MKQPLLDYRIIPPRHTALMAHTYAVEKAGGNLDGEGGPEFVHLVDFWSLDAHFAEHALDLSFHLAKLVEILNSNPIKFEL